MPQDTLTLKIEELVMLFDQLSKNGVPVEKVPTDWDRNRAEAVLDEIFKELMWNPGQLIHIQDENKMLRGKSLVDYFWDKRGRADELMERLHDGEFGGLLFQLTGDYVGAVSELRPMFIAVEPTREVREYFQEAVRAWLHGVDKGGLILCWSSIEMLLREKLLRQDFELVYKLRKKKDPTSWIERTCRRWIESAEQLRWLDKGTAKKALAIKEARDKAVHRQFAPSSKEVHQFIMDTKTIIDQLMKSRASHKKH
jgi:hypothetical protein